MNATSTYIGMHLVDMNFKFIILMIIYFFTTPIWWSGIAIIIFFLKYVFWHGCLMWMYSAIYRIMCIVANLSPSSSSTWGWVSLNFQTSSICPPRSIWSQNIIHALQPILIFLSIFVFCCTVFFVYLLTYDFFSSILHICLLYNS
jgi:hypothetical protein